MFRDAWHNVGWYAIGAKLDAGTDANSKPKEIIKAVAKKLKGKIVENKRKLRWTSMTVPLLNKLGE